MSSLTQHRGAFLANKKLVLLPSIPGVSILVNDNVSATTSNGNGSLNAPAGRAVGDLMMLFRIYGVTTPTPNPLTGYTLRLTNDGQNGFANFRRIETRVATADANDNTSWAGITSDLADYTILAAVRTPYRTLTGATESGNFGGRVTNTGVTLTADGVTAPAPGAELIFVLIHGISGVPGVSIDTPAGYSLLATLPYTVATGNAAGQPGVLAIFGKTLTAAGATGNTNVTVHLSSGSHNYVYYGKKVVLTP